MIWVMNSTYRIVSVLAAVAMISSISTILQQASAQGIIVYDKEQFTKLNDEFEKAVLDEAAVDPPAPDKIQSLLDEYNRNFMSIFGLEPATTADSPTEADPPGELEPPDPDLEPPDPDKS